jgi:hypothetical protein
VNKFRAEERFSRIHELLKCDPRLCYILQVAGRILSLLEP